MIQSMLTEALLKHHLDRARRGEIKNAISNCHVRGLHSIVLHDEPGNRLRLFYADTANEMHEGAIAIHRHHCDVTLVPVFGKILHVLCGKPVEQKHAFFQECTYSSGVLGESALVPTGRRFVFRSYVSTLLDAPMRLEASALHSVHAPAKTTAAWLVLEGAEDSSYNSNCYSLNPGAHDPRGLYEPLSDVAGVIEEVLTGAWINTRHRF